MIETNFKHTDIGLIPHDWEIFTVANDCYVKARIGWQGLTTAEYLSSGYFGLITSTDLIDGEVNWGTCHFVSEDRYNQDTKIQVKKFDILVSKDGTIGKVGIVKHLPFPATLNSGVFVIRSNNQKQSQIGLSLAFVSPYFKDFIKRLKAGSTIAHLYQKDLVNFMYPLPPSQEEQERIAGALSEVDELIAAMDEQIAKKRLVKKGAMQQLLSGRSRLPGFTDKWDNVKVNDICNRYDNLRIPVAAGLRKSGDVPYNGEYILVAEDGANSLTDYPIQYACGKIWVNNHAHVLQAKDNIAVNRFLMYAFKTIDFEANIVGSGRAKLNADTLMKLELTIPVSIEEQRAIAGTLSAMDEEIQTLQEERDKYAFIKQGMMQQLLTGKIRI